MGFFENLGRKVGQFTHEAKQTAADEAAYACEHCGERFHVERAECPQCGSDQVVERDLPDASQTDDPDTNVQDDDVGDRTDPSDLDSERD
ncbi:zinc ribbon domain-containing protein [Natrialbaceae archaeon A-CW1-1]